MPAIMPRMRFFLEALVAINGDALHKILLLSSATWLPWRGCRQPLRGVHDDLAILHRNGKAIKRTRGRPRQHRSCRAKLRAVTGAKNDLAFREIVHRTLHVCTFVRQGEHAGRVMRDNTPLFPEMPDTGHRQCVEGPKRKPSAPFSWGGGREKEFEEEPELPSHHDEHRGDPAQPHQAPAGKPCPGVFLRWRRLFLHVIPSCVSGTC